MIHKAKKIEDVKIVVNGAGASAVSCTKLYVSLGARLENIVMLDSKGVISKARTDLNDKSVISQPTVPIFTHWPKPSKMPTYS